MHQSPYIERYPHAALLPWIDTYWAFTVGAGSSTGVLHRVLPDLASDIVFDLGAVPVPSFAGATAKVVGVMTKAKISVMISGSLVLGVRFKPQAAAVVLKMPASDIKNQDYSLMDLGLGQLQIRDRLGEE